MTRALLLEEMAMSLQPVQALCTVEDYLALERASEERHEYLDGRLYAMAGESPEHGTICTNLTMLIASQLRGTPCQAWAKDTKVRSGPTPRPRHVETSAPTASRFATAANTAPGGDASAHAARHIRPCGR